MGTRERKRSIHIYLSMLSVNKIPSFDVQLPPREAVSYEQGTTENGTACLVVFQTHFQEKCFDMGRCA